jgi:hypothetical protein
MPFHSKGHLLRTIIVERNIMNGSQVMIYMDGLHILRTTIMEVLLEDIFVQRLILKQLVK